MANPTQIYEIINDLAEQSLGMKDLEPTSTSFISVGKTVLSSTENTDAFFKKLVDRIGRTVLALREYQIDVTEMSREPFEYGAILQKISFQMPQAQESDTWLEVPANSNPFEETETTFMQMFFDKWSAWEVPSTCPDVQLETAFTNATTMMAFIDGILTKMNDSMKLAYENLGHIARASLIGDVITSSVANCAINLLEEYNTETSSTLTVNQALRSIDFLKWSGRRIKLVSDRMQKNSVTFNKAGWQRHTPKQYQVFEVLSDFATAMDTYLQSDTYHNELTKLDMYKEVQYWQGSGENWKFDSVSGIDVTIESYDFKTGTVTTKNVQATGIVAVIRDIDSCGITMDKRRTKSIYNPRREVTNYWLKAEMGMFRDMSENCVVFYMADTKAS